MSLHRDFRVFQYTPLDLRGVGGVEHHIRRLSDELRALGCAVVAGSVDGEAEKPGSLPVIVHSHGDRLPPLAMVSGENKLWVHTLHGTSVARAIACREYLSFSALKASLKEGFAARNADGLIFVSEGVECQARRYFRVAHSTPFRVVPNGADPVPESGTGEFDAYRPFILFLGRGDDRVKNTERLLEAFRHAREKRPDLRLLVAPGRGFPPGIPGVEHLDSITMLQKSALYTAASALALPSLYEADSLVIWEALAHGTSIVASTGVGRSKALGGYDAVRFVPPRDVGALTQALLAATQDRRRGTPHYRPWSQVARETLAFYEFLRKAESAATRDSH